MAAGIQIYLKGIDELERRANKLIKEVNEAKQKTAWNVVNCLKARIYAWENSQKPKSEEPPI